MGSPPFAPEPLPDMQGRYGTAVAEVFDHDSLRLGTGRSPCKTRGCVFDFACGVRLTVGRIRLGTDDDILLMQAGIVDESPYDDAVRRAGAEPLFPPEMAPVFLDQVSRREWPRPGSSRTPSRRSIRSTSGGIPGTSRR